MGVLVVVVIFGCLIVYLDLGYVDFSIVWYFIFDEVDCMFDMGFVYDILKIVQYFFKD